MKSSLPASAVLLAVLISAVSCGSDSSERRTDADTTASRTDTAPVTEAVSETENPYPAPELPEADYGGKEIRILEYEKNPYIYYYDFDSKEEDAGELVNDAVHKRNQLVEERFNCSIRASNLEFPVDEAKKSILAGGDDYDIMDLYIDEALTMALEGMFVNFYDIPHISLDMPWWDHAIQRDLALMNQIYVMTGDISIYDEELNYCVYFNKNVVKANDIPDPYQLVKDNKWTLDQMMELGRNVSRDVNGDGVRDEKDSFGILTDYGMLWLFYFTSGCTFVELDNSGMPSFTIDNPHTMEVSEKLVELFEETETVLWASKCSDWWKTLDKVFMEDRALFRPGSIYDIRFYRDMKADFGILPYPKYDSVQEEYYHPIASQVCPAICIPTTNQDLDRTGVLLEALAYTSRDTVTKAYYDVNLYSKLTRDDASGEMLDIIFATKRYDLGKVFNWGDLNNVVGNLVLSKNGLAADWASKQKIANNKMEKTLNFFREHQ